MSAHCRAFEFFGGVPEIVVPDNLKSGVARACRYEPDINPAYQEMACHYGVAVIPARARKPRDRAKAIPDQCSSSGHSEPRSFWYVSSHYSIHGWVRGV